jgi:hypothetical protein
MHPSDADEKTDLLDYFLISSNKTIFNQTTTTTTTTTKHLGYNTTKESSSSPFALFLITVGKSAQNSIKNHSSPYHNFDKYWKAAISHHHLKSGESDFGSGEPPTKIQKILLESDYPSHTKTNLICVFQAWESAEETVDICIHNSLKRMNEVLNQIILLIQYFSFTFFFTFSKNFSFLFKSFLPA